MRPRATPTHVLAPCAHAVAALVLLAAPSLGQTTWYVDAAGVPPGTGTQADPYTSIQYAADQATTLTSDTLLILPGTYAENLVLPDKDLTLEASGGPAVTRIVPDQAGDLVTAPAGVGVRLVGLTIEGAFGGGAAGVLSGGDLASVRVDGCVLTQNEVALLSRYDLFVSRSTIAGNGFALRTEGVIPLAQIGNSVFWDNSDGYELADTFFSFQSYCVGDLDPSLAGADSVQADPLLWDAAAGDFRLRPGSPAIDAAHPNLPLDADGSPADVGVFPYDPAYAPQPVTYCTPKVASDGCLATIAAVGATPTSVPSLSSNEAFLVEASDVSELKNGLFFFGLAPSAFPFQGGWFCIQPPTARTSVQNSGTSGVPCSGAFALDLNALIQSGAYPFVGAGSSIYGQYWFRDPADPFQSIRTDAVALGISE